MPQFKEFLINGFSVLAFIILIKLLSSYLPDMGVLGGLKRLIANV